MKMEMGLAFSCLSPCCGESNWCFQFLSKVSESSSSHVLRHSSNGQPYTLLRVEEESQGGEGEMRGEQEGRNFGEGELFILQRPDSAQSFKWITGKQWPLAKSLLCNKQGDICEIFLSARALLPWDWLFSMVLESEYILGSLMCLSFFF